MTTLPAAMKAVTIAEPGGPDVLRIADCPMPVPGPAEVLIRVAAAGVNRPDLFQRAGHYAPPPGASALPGLEVAGTVVATGGPDLRWSAGAQVVALVAGGGYAEYCAAPAVQCLPLPPGLDFVQGASLPETFFTVWANVFEAGQLQQSERLLVHGGGSGIGVAAIQLARSFGADVAVTAGSDEKCERCLALGASVAVNYRTQDFVDVVRSWSGERGVDVVLDMVGGDYTPRNLSLLAPGGRLVQIATLRGSRAEVDLRLVMSRRLLITGSTLRPRPIAEKGRIARALETHVWPRVARGEVAPIIDTVWPLDAAADAHRQMERGDHFGKIVLRVGQ